MEKIDHKTVKIELSLQDMANYNLTYEQMDYNDTTTRKAILEIVQQVQHKTDLKIQFNKLFIEAFPDLDGGCILYINLMEASVFEPKSKTGFRSFDTPLVLELDRLSTVESICKRLFQQYNHLIIKSSLYYVEQEECYHLLLYTYCRMEKKIISTIEEYGSFLGKGPVLAAVTKEHSREIIKDNAIETVVKYLC